MEKRKVLCPQDVSVAENLLLQRADTWDPIIFNKSLLNNGKVFF